MRSSCEPLKWSKYKLLERLDLIPIGSLERTIHRFPSDGHAALQWLHKAMRTDQQLGEQVLYVLKGVPRYLHGQLPNFRVVAELDTSTLNIWLESIANIVHEIWICCTSVGSNRFSVAGRLSISSSGIENHVLEQVWRCSPRMIESYTAHFAGALSVNFAVVTALSTIL